MNQLKRRIRSCLALAAMALAATALTAGSAIAYESPSHADSEQYSFDWFETESTSIAAGARSDYRNALQMKHVPGDTSGSTTPYGRTKKFELDLPAGLVGDPTAVPTCPREVFLRFFEFEGCPADTRIGTASVNAFGVADGTMSNKPVFNLETSPEEPALFGLKLGTALYAYIEVEVSSDGEITAVIDEAPIGSPVWWSDVTMFGVADPTPGEDGDEVPFMSNPTNCTQPFTTAIRGESYEYKFDSDSFTQPARTECADVPFAPSISVTPSNAVAGEAAGMNVGITVPQSKDPDTKATAHVKDVTMTFPEGMVTSASSATGLGSCAPQQFGYHQETPITCPLNSKIGEVEVQTPILEQPLTGPVYVAKQNDNPFNSLLALYMAPQGSGVTIKLAGKVDLDPGTGRLTTTFMNNPQQPFSQLNVRLKGGPRAPLSLPRACGTYTTTAQLTSWAMPSTPVPASSQYTVSQNCGQQDRFAPGFSAGTANPQAGAFSPFMLRITRPNAAQANVSQFAATLPEGLLAKLAGVPLCSDAQALAATCPETTKVGTTTVGVGAGPTPVFAPEPGKAPTALYLAGPYKGAPYSIVAEVPAQAGPFDLGTVVIRNALRVDPHTAQVTAVSDPLPQLLQGIPISYRDIRVDVNRPNFTINPTDCDVQNSSATIASAGGPSASVADRFQAAGCRQLGFKPKLKLSLKGQTKRGGNPALRAVLRQPGGQANTDRVQVILPKTAFIDNAHINNPCTRAQYAANACPPKSILGWVKAYTPLLDQPLTGNVYFRANGGARELPDLVAALRGPIAIDLVGYIDSVQNKRAGTSRVRTTFATVPDAPVSRFEMNLKGGRFGLIENSAHLCKAKKGLKRLELRIDGQNGRERDSRPVLRSSSCKRTKKATKKR